MKKIVLNGIVAGIIIFVVSMAVSYLFMLIPVVSADYQNTNVMRPWSDPLMSLYFLYPFIQGIILAWAYHKFKPALTCTHGVGGRGAEFGVAMFLIATLPGMWVSYSSFPLSLLTIVSWTISGLVSLVLAGAYLAKMDK